MKKLMIVIASMCLFGCESKNVTINNRNPDSLPIINGKIINTYIIDSCEYIGSVYGVDSDFLLHKGNCKFCIERNKKLK